MNKISCLNLTYKSPYEDMEDSIGLNPDKTININFTLLSLKNKLLENINTIDKLLEHSDYIDNIILIDNDIIEIKIDDQITYNQLINNGILIENNYDSDTDSTDDFTAENYDFGSPRETNHDRLNTINNLVRQDNNYPDNSSDSDSNSSNSNEDITDDKNMIYITNKYRYDNFVSIKSNSSESD